MSRGLSRSQIWMLGSIAYQEDWRRGHGLNPAVPWFEIDRGPDAKRESVGYVETPDDRWSYEITVRRALTSLEKRGLVTTARYSFQPDTYRSSRRSSGMEWVVARDHFPGECRLATGAVLTGAGRRVVDEERRKRKS